MSVCALSDPFHLSWSFSFLMANGYIEAVSIFKGKVVNVKSLLEGTGHHLVSRRSVSTWLGVLPDMAEVNPFLEYINNEIRGYKHADNRFGFLYNNSQRSPQDALDNMKPVVLRFDRDHLYEAQSYIAWAGQKILPGLHAPGSPVSLNRMFSVYRVEGACLFCLSNIFIVRNVVHPPFSFIRSHSFLWLG